MRSAVAICSGHAEGPAANFWDAGQPTTIGRVERWRARGSVRWRSHGFRRGPQSGSHSDVSSAPPKIPCIEFSPARLQTKVSCHQPGPSRTGPELKCQVHIPSGASRFDLTFVAYVPLADYRWHYQPVRLRLTAATTLAHGPFAPSGFIVSCSSPPLRPDPPVSPAPPDFTSSAYTGGRARRLGLGCERHLPCFGSALPPRVRPPLRREEKQVHIPAESLLPWPSSHNHGVSSSTPDIGFRRDSLSTLLSVRFAAARVIARSPGPIRPGETLLSGRRELCTRAFPREGHPSRESGIATRHPGRTPRPDFHRLEHCRYRLHGYEANTGRDVTQRL